MPSLSALRRRFLDTGIIVVFLGLLAAPTLDKFARPDAARGPEPERRKAAPHPEWSWKARDLASFPDRFRAWFDDSFGLRDVFLRWNSIVKVYLLHTSPSRNLVLGKDAWWLYRGAGAIDDWRGTVPFEEKDLEAWKSVLVQNRDDLRRRGIEYLFVIGPNKETIYPEKVPDRYNRVGPTRLDQLVEYLERHSDLRILDLRPALLAAKGEDAGDDELYFRNGTHWSARGIQVAYAEILRRLGSRFPALRPLDASALERLPCPDLDSWAPTMYIGDLVRPSAMYCKVRGSPRARVVQRTGTESTGRRRITEVDDAALPSALLVHDSYGQTLDLILPENFRRLAAYWTNQVDFGDVDREQPDVFIHLYVERALVSMPPATFRIRGGGSEREAFERSTRPLFRLAPGGATELSTSESFALSRGTDVADANVAWRVLAERSVLLLPKVDFPPDDEAVVALDLEAPAQTQVGLLESDDAQSELARRAIVSADAGRNHLYVRLAKGAIRGRLAIRPGAPGTYRIRGLEIRLVEPVDATGKPEK